MSDSMRDKIFKYDRLVPRYTSYPTAPHFKPVEGDEMVRGMMAALPENAPISLYLHVPFCQKMCWYCGCHTKVTQRYAPVEDYAHLMLREIDMLADAIQPHHRIQHIHFGGGSPGMLRGCDFELIMGRIRAGLHIAPDAEIAVEIDPRGLTEGRVAAYAKAGVNRISLGVQDFDDTVLASVNREQPFELSAQAVTWFRENGINHFNFDLLYGLPHQTTAIMEQTIAKALTLNPDRISLFGYAHVPWMKKHMRLIDESALPDQTARYNLFETGARCLQEAGYVAIGIDHFAKTTDKMAIAAREGKLNRNFQGYTTDESSTLIGIGASSIGKFNEGYVQNAVDMPHYRDAILDGKFAVKKFCPLSNDDRLRGAVIERLMCDFKVDLTQVCRQNGFADDALDKHLSDLKPYVDDGFLTIDAPRTLRIHPEAKQIVRIICSVFDTYLAQTSDTPRHAKAV